MKKETFETPVIVTEKIPRKPKGSKLEDCRLEKGIVIPKGSKMMEVGFGFKITFGLPTYDITIGIGNDHHARFIIDKEAYEALINGAEVHISH